MKENMLVLEMLLKNKMITRQNIAERIDEAKRSKNSILDVLVRDRIITEAEIVLIFHNEWGFERYDPLKDALDLRALSFFSKEQAKKHLVFPLNQENDDQLTVVMADPSHEETIRRIKRIAEKRLKILVAEKSCTLGLIEKYYHQEYVNQDRAVLIKHREQKELTLEPSIITLVNDLIDEGVSRGASDIHVEVFPQKVQVRFRIDGVLKPIGQLSKETWRGVITRLKILAGCDIAEHRHPQDGAFTTNHEGRQIDVRLSIIPTIHGEKIVLRLLDEKKFLISIDELGFSNQQKQVLKEIIKAPHGMVLICGPTGSGKSTTLYSLLNGMDSRTQNIITIEDPVEFQMEDINQIQVSEKTGLNFANGLRAILRQDPNVIMVGEIRDEDTAEIATRAAITGHLVLSTLHTNNAIASINRLMDMKIPLYLLSAALRGVISQKLIKRLCPNCKKKSFATAFEKGLLGMADQEIELFYPEGCSLCHGTGYLGRIAVQEVMKVSRKIREAISKGADYDGIRKVAIEEGFKPIEESLKRHLLQGETSISQGLEILAFENEWHR
ncbi:GspE/PulE family protein [Acetobacterium carbinolicum]|jgi:type IV pilus assembly protein PilB|uniref:GspE/PulE family protein n=1 Tax=Acetobacterium TaxID=33951 RepID=UPI000DBEAEF6|nr:MULTISPECIES: GspE/PulE family protein [unclassified Acetobacterium]AWW27067.1 type II secretion system protein GspE [Acetobacterium sp. KB-1]MDZ5724262.1 GspE/PulE family protein [Acetobacterium sp. K1/6]